MSASSLGGGIGRIAPVDELTQNCDREAFGRSCSKSAQISIKLKAVVDCAGRRPYNSAGYSRPNLIQRNVRREPQFTIEIVLAEASDAVEDMGARGAPHRAEHGGDRSNSECRDGRRRLLLRCCGGRDGPG